MNIDNNENENLVVEEQVNETVGVEETVEPEFELIENIGRLRKTLKDKCAECGGVIQIRVYQEPEIEDGEEIWVDKEYRYCVNCGELGEVKPKRKRGKTFNGYEEERDNGKANKKRNSSQKSPRRDGRKNYQ
jgi:hypothetical protein